MEFAARRPTHNQDRLAAADEKSPCLANKRIPVVVVVVVVVVVLLVTGIVILFR